MSLAMRPSGMSVLVGPMAALGLLVSGCYDDAMFAPGKGQHQSAQGGGGQGGGGQGGGGGDGDGGSPGPGGAGGGGNEFIAVSGRYPSDGGTYVKGNEILKITGSSLITGQFSKDSEVVPFQLDLASPGVVHIGTFDEEGTCVDGFDTSLKVESDSDEHILLTDRGGTRCAAITSFFGQGLYTISLFNKSNSSDTKYSLEIWLPTLKSSATNFTERYTLVSDTAKNLGNVVPFTTSADAYINVAVVGMTPHACRAFDGTLRLDKTVSGNELEPVAIIPGGCVQSADITGVDRIAFTKNPGAVSFDYYLFVTIRQEKGWITSTWPVN